MNTYRTPPKAIQEYKNKDPNFPVTAKVLRRWLKEGKVRSVPFGKNSRLVNMESFEDYLRSQGD